MPARRPLLFSLACTVAGVFSSCTDQDVIRQYKVEKRPAEEATESKDEVSSLAAAPSMAWFFKVTGPRDETAKLVEPFRQLVQSVKFDADGAPEWTLPAGWQSRRDERSIRFATLTAPTTPPLELSVTHLPLPPDYLLSNYNRWRGQLGQPPLEGADWQQSDTAKQELTQVETGAGQADVMNIEGTDPQIGDARMLTAIIPDPATPRAPSRSPPPSAPPVSASPVEPAAKPFTYALPEGWDERPAGQFQTAVFAVKGEDPTLVVSISSVRGSLFDNVNRWCGQIQKPEMNEAELKAAATPVTISGSKADYFVLEGPEETILGAVLPQGDASWFFKARGPKALAERERGKFEAFLQSIQFKQ
jgi:hypothetical protein